MDKSPFKTEPDGSVCLSAVALCKRLFCFHFQWKGTSQPHEKRKGETDMNDIMDLSPSERDELLNERPLFEFTAVLTDDRIETEYGNYRYGELLGGFLTFDSYEYAQAYFDMSDAYYEDRQEDYQAAEQRAEEQLFRMPLYRDMTERRTELSAHRRRNPYANRKIHETMYVQQMILLNYRGILIESVIDADDDNAGKEKMYGQLLSCFGDDAPDDHFHEPFTASTKTEYRIRQCDDGIFRHCRRMQFRSLLDFLYIDLYESIKRESFPKPCKLCHSIFWEEMGAAFEYCSNIAPGETVRTCREVGAKKGFKTKLKNNPIWKLYDRAYKKYYARRSKCTMTENAFALWLIKAQGLRDEALKMGIGNIDIEEYRRKLNEA